MAIWKDKENAADFYNPSIDYKSDTSCILGPMSISCQFCDAMKFKGEAPGLCCSGGKVHLPVLRDPPEPLHTLLSSDSNGRCTKRYPRDFLKETQTGRDGYPLYRSRRPEDGGFSTVINIRHSEVVVDNRWIVPYCPLLSRIFCAHINVEYCNSIKSIKYVCKYINKGSDMAVFDVTSSDGIARNEVNQYKMGRYISSNEAVWRILNFPIHERHPTVIHLSVHLENGQRVYFTEGNAAERARFAPETTLTAFFRLCNEDEFARTLFYHQVPLGIVKTRSGVDEKLVNLYLTILESSQLINYKEACQVRGLLENDEHWNATLEEAAFMHSPRMLRDLFAVMLQVCAVSNPNQLWINHQENLSEDIMHRVRIQQRNMDLEFSTEILNEALIIIEDKVRSLGGSDLKSVGLPQPNRDSSTIDDVLREITYNVSELRRFLEENEGKMLPDQREIFQKITDSVFQETGGIFFLDAPGGTGKTFLLNLILEKVRESGEIALALASSGIAATLLTGGRTELIQILSCS
ncbi:ATP-dependent DNA helicase [Trichonephila clavata]|uniref:ATP-dependent DNA helicase n=1 Tax=Trichonephila clavata TaxID=2740835 RepID=A0A8X6K7K8_TRICU|nr:ATP-dependent DNA helicase [Trichonephila clavata]